MEVPNVRCSQRNIGIGQIPYQEQAPGAPPPGARAATLGPTPLPLGDCPEVERMDATPL